MSKCSYNLNLSGTDSHDNLLERYDGWECDRETHGDTEYCTFHLPVEKKTPEATTEAFRDSLQMKGREPNTLIGAKFAHLDLSYSTLEGVDNYPIVLHRAEIGRLSFRKGTVTHEIRLVDGSVGKLNCYDATFKKFVNFNSSTVCEPELDYATVDSGLSIKNAQINGFLRCKNMDVEGDVRLSNTVVAGDKTAEEANLRSADFGYEEELRNSKTYDSIVDFAEAKISDQLGLTEMRIDGSLQLSAAHIGTLELIDTKFESELTPNGLRGEEAVLRLRMTDTRIEDVQIGPLPLIDGPIVIRKGSFNSGEIFLSENGPDYIFYKSAVGNLIFNSERNKKDVFNRIRFQNTRFDGFEFADYTDALSRVNWRIHSERSLSEGNHHPERHTTSPKIGTIVSTYLRCKNGAKQVGDNTAASEFFLKEMTFRGRMHTANAVNATVASEMIANGWKAISNALLRVTAGYGERPSRTALSSAAIVVLFGGMYTVLQPELPYSIPLGYFVYSIESFVALVLGQPDTTDSVVSLLTAVEGFFGTFLIALFVFTLTRSINR